MRVKLTLGYDGTEYCGWQVQPNATTVQQKLEEAVFLATGEKVRVTGSGRTDAGVHAKGQVAHFDTECTIPPEKIYRALNAHLPINVRVFKSEQVGQEFHACNSAKKKTYRYSLYLGDTENPLKERYSVKIDGKVDFEKMKEVATLFLGEHDFKGFCASGSGAKTTIRTIYDIAVEKAGDDIKVTVTGNGFLYNMVRIMVGAILLVGKGEIEKREIERMLKYGERPSNARTLPARGLCLERVEY